MLAPKNKFLGDKVGKYAMMGVVVNRPLQNTFPGQRFGRSLLKD
ncbi:hypothetical protein RISK_005746 [Rhodopirellula islandica]|uniref:Uncharacterized protein n=1 Tax=Rhodopirellula islandica TaxID=595434 RepID=A0A0J1B782_RHOIS|nr:hypothetical protein RISK_005746 [Rhodopirellula islandica]